MIKKYIAILLILTTTITFLIFGLNILFHDDDKHINVKVDDNEYSLPLGSTYKDLSEEVGNVSSDINSEAVLKDNQEIPKNNNDNYKISINNASFEELITLPGIGEKTALKIIEYRDTYGPFWTIDDLKNVKGIGDKKFEKLKEYISI